jgi:hypothetical protein
VDALPGCPSNDTIAELVGRQLGDESVAEVEAHVADCSMCRRLVGTLAAGSFARLLNETPEVDTHGHAHARHDHATGQRYVIRQELARGGMGRISIADDTLLGRTVAIKELLAPSFDRLGAREGSAR